MTTQARLFDDKVEEGTDKLLLILTFLVGVIGSGTAKLTGQPPWVAALISAGSIVAYALIVWRKGLLRIEPEAIGDNCYYLGFLFTLASLAITLYQLGDYATGPDALRGVVSGFGIALSSTIVGIALRVLMLRLRPDIVARDREARQSLQEATRDLVTEMADSTRRLKDFAVESNQILVAQRDRLLEETGTVLGTHLDAVGQGTVARMNALDAVLERVSVEAADRIGLAVTEAIAPLAKTVSPALEDIARKIAEELEHVRAAREAANRVSAAGDEMHEHLAGVAKRLDTLGKKLDAVTGRIVDRLGKASDRIDVASADAARELDGAFRRMTDAAGRFDASEQLERVMSVVELPLGNLTAAADRLSGCAAQLERLVEARTTSGEEINELVRTMNDRLVPLASLPERIAGVPTVLQAVADETARARSGMETSLNGLKSALSDATGASNLLRDAIVDMRARAPAGAPEAGAFSFWRRS